MMDIIQRRNSLVNTIKGIKNGYLTIGIIGGSISVADEENRWPEPVIAWFLNKYPGLCINVENASIGATGSEFGVFRVENHIISKKCDLVFVEFAVNDQGQKTEKRIRTREGLLRKLLSGGRTDVVIVYTFSRNMYGEMKENKVPQTILDFELLANHYQLSSVWMGLKALNDVRQGKMKWKEWLPDGRVHPENRGSLSYAESVIQYLEDALSVEANADKTDKKLPAPYNDKCWEQTYQLPFEKVCFDGPWTFRRWTKTPWYERIIQTDSPEAKLSFDFEGRGISIGFMFGKVSADFRYRIDFGEWIEHNFDRPDWCPEMEVWHRIVNIAEDLPLKTHHFEYQVIFRSDISVLNGCKGTSTKIGLIGIVK